MTPLSFSDKQAKAAMLKWPVFPDGWLSTAGSWVRLLPSKTSPSPYLHSPGGALLSNPDGLFATFGQNFADLLVLEHCSSRQNFYDKRSRYGPSHSAVMLGLPERWLNTTATTHGGQGGTTMKFGAMVQASGNVMHPAWLAPSCYANAPPRSIDWKFPVRKVVCVYFLTPKDRNFIRDSGITFPRHEFISMHGRIAQITHKGLREWLQGALASNQIY